jgi:hypothetical protein
MQQIGQSQLPFIEPRLYVGEHLFALRKIAHEALACGDEGSNIEARSLRHPDSLRLRIAFRAQPVGFSLPPAALLLE